MTTVQHTANVIKEALRSEFRQSPLFIFCVNLFVVGSAFHRHQLDAQTFFLS